MLKPIETEFKGIRFRSRLEARWAVFFDELGIGWEYEKEGYLLTPFKDEATRGYLPDFWLDIADVPGAGYFIEIKGREPSVAEKGLMIALARGSGHTVWLFHGQPGDCILYGAHRNGNVWCKPLKTVEETWSWFFRFRGGSSADTERSIRRARQARFEHGATP